MSTLEDGSNRRVVQEGAIAVGHIMRAESSLRDQAAKQVDELCQSAAAGELIHVGWL